MSCLRTPAVLLLLLAQGCGDPAPGEGVEKPHEQGTMPEVVTAAAAIRTPEIPTIDLQSMTEAEYEKVLRAPAHCRFSYSRAGEPVFAAVFDGDSARGAAKIHGKLLEVRAPSVNARGSLQNGGRFVADGVHVQVLPEEDDGQRKGGVWQRVATAVLELDAGLKVGYRGWYSCEDNAYAPAAN